MEGYEIIKRLFVLLLAIKILFLLVACGEKENNTNIDETKSSENKDTANTKTNLVSYYLAHESGMKMHLNLGG